MKPVILKAATVAILVAALSAVAAPSAAALPTVSDAPPAASALSTTDTFQSVSFDKTAAHYGEQVIATLPFSVSDDAANGDTASVTLPAELSPKGVLPFTVFTPDGSTLGEAAWTEDDRTLVLTFSKYVETHEDVTGELHIAVAFNPDTTPEEYRSYNLVFTTNTAGSFSAPLTLLEGVTGTPEDQDTQEFHLSKSWLDYREGGVSGRSALVLYAALPATGQGFKDGLVFNLKPRADFQLDCEPVEAETYYPGVRVLVSDPSNRELHDMDGSRFALTCTPEGIKAKFDRLEPSEYVYVQVYGSILDTSKKTYWTDASVEYAGKTETTEKSITRSTGDGDGSGIRTVLIGDTVFSDSNANGIQDAGEVGLPGVMLSLTRSDGLSALDNMGNASNRTMTGDDGTYGFYGFEALPAGVTYSVAYAPTAEDGLNGWTPTTSTAQQVAPLSGGQADLARDFGFTAPAPVVPSPTPVPPAEPVPAPEPPTTPEPTPTPIPQPEPAPEPPVASEPPSVPAPEPEAVPQSPETPQPVVDTPAVPVPEVKAPEAPQPVAESPAVVNAPLPDALAETGFLSTTLWSILAAVSGLGLFFSIQSYRIRRREQK